MKGSSVYYRGGQWLGAAWVPDSTPIFPVVQRELGAAAVGTGEPLKGVIPGRVEDANPESRDSGSGPADHPGMTGTPHPGPDDPSLTAHAPSQPAPASPKARRCPRNS